MPAEGLRAEGLPVGLPVGLPCAPARFRGRLRVFWWAEDARGRWVEVHHAPVEVAFADAAGLRAALEQFSRPAGWSRVLARRADLGLGAVLHERHAALDFEAAAGRFLARLREGGRSRCELALHEARRTGL
jgi:hypothetical protein